MVLDHKRIQLKAGEKKSIEISRPNGKRISGRVVNRQVFKMDKVLVWVCPANVKAASKPSFMIDHGLDLTSCNAKGEFTTAPISPGRYAVFIEGYEAPSRSTGIQRPRFIGRTEVVVPVKGQPPVVEVKYRDLRDDIDYASYVRGSSAKRYIEQLKPNWSETQLGIQFGISHWNEQRRFSLGERVPLTMFMRNVSDKSLNVEWATDVFAKIPSVGDVQGKGIPLESVDTQGGVSRYSEVLKPGEPFAFQGSSGNLVANSRREQL